MLIDESHNYMDENTKSQILAKQIKYHDDSIILILTFIEPITVNALIFCTDCVNYNDIRNFRSRKFQLLHSFSKLRRAPPTKTDYSCLSNNFGTVRNPKVMTTVIT